MKIIFKAILSLTLLVFITSCGGKKEGDFDHKEPSEIAKQDNKFPLADKGKEIFEGKGTCATCHKIDIKLVGPSVQDIAKTYKENHASIATFLKGEEKPIVDSSQFDVMKANLELTKTFTDEERESVEHYILSQEK